MSQKSKLDPIRRRARRKTLVLEIVNQDIFD